MSKRYSATRTKSPTLNRKRILLAWLMIIIAIMLPAIMYYLKYRHTNVQIKTVTKIQTKNNKPLKFDFYTMLPNMEVPIPAPQKTSTQSILKTAPGAYILQVASVKTEPAANRLRDQLLELGYRAFVQAYKNQQAVGYRVIIGPYISLAAAESDQRGLHQAHFESLLLQLKLITTTKTSH